ncbi:hypothetical protein V6Z11_D05G149900 [Gossypium hirsutum]
MKNPWCSCISFSLLDHSGYLLSLLVMMRMGQAWIIDPKLVSYRKHVRKQHTAPGKLNSKFWLPWY